MHTQPRCSYTIMRNCASSAQWGLEKITNMNVPIICQTGDYQWKSEVDLGDVNQPPLFIIASFH